MNTLPLNALRAFALTVHHGGVRAAARELEVSHSAISRHLAELERWLGIPVTERGEGQRDLAVTAQGAKLAAATLEALRAIDHAADAVREQRSPYAVTISTTPSFAARWLLPRLPALERAYPRFEVSLVIDQRLDDPRAMPCDFAIRTGAGPWAGVVAQPLMRDALYPVMSPSFWEASGKPKHPDQLRRLRLLHDRDASASWQLWRQTHGPADLDVRSGPRFASTDLILRAAAQGMGVALARDRLVQDDLASGALIQPFGDLSVELDTAYWLVTPEHVAVRESAKTVMRWLRREAEAPTGSRLR
ncbi:LysR substrate-binding domain-containing protein [Dyella subtropica]|uniref:LysR substrate-binding domain-containing protein n=1 Tax=Dyella subtropica TaxID=2992127 RepID=UPI00225739C6|nr:LysR substrate-binding domain-containing protein [Dyella subtropica]